MKVKFYSDLFINKIEFELKREVFSVKAWAEIIPLIQFSLILC